MYSIPIQHLHARHFIGHTWTDLFDPSLLEVGTLLYNPADGYTGEIDRTSERSGHELLIVRWYISSARCIEEAYTRVQLDWMNLWWVDPVMQEN